MLLALRLVISMIWMSIKQRSPTISELVIMSDELNKAMVPTPLMKIDDVVIQGRYNEDEHFRHFLAIRLVG